MAEYNGRTSVTSKGSGRSGSINSTDAESATLLGKEKYRTNSTYDALNDREPDSTSCCCLVKSSPSTTHPHHHHTQVYRRRWWIIIVYCICSATQSTMWNTWSPINFAVSIAFGWGAEVVALIPALSNAGFVILAFYLMYIVETKGLRFGMVICTCLLLLCVSAWNLGVPLQYQWLIYLGSACNGISAAIFMAAPPLLSVLWFPVEERTTATALAAGSSYLGTGLSFLSGPLISGANVTEKDVDHSSAVSEDFRSYLQNGIQNVVYYDTGLAVLCIILVLVYFPAAPPKPPSHVAELRRVDFKAGLKALVTNGSFWLLNVAYNLPNACYNSWLPLISMSLKSLGISESLSGWLGFASIMSGCASSIVVSVFADHFKKKTKLFLMAMTAGATLCMVVLLCIQQRYIKIADESLEATLYTMCILCGAFVNGVIPLYYELACDSVYPVHEGLACEFVCVFNNAVGMIFFLVFLIPTVNANPQWMLWLTTVVTGLSLPLLFKIKEHYYRLEVEDEDSSSDEE